MANPAFSRWAETSIASSSGAGRHGQSKTKMAARHLRCMCFTAVMANPSATPERAGEQLAQRPWMPNLLVHDLRRSAVRNFDKNGVSQIVGMMISGHKTASVYKRHRIVPENDIRETLQKVEQAIEQQKKNQPVRTITASSAQ